MAGFRDKYEWIYPAPLLDLIQTLSPEVAGSLMQAIFSYSRTGKKLPVPVEATLLYEYICMDIELKGKAYEDMCEKKREIGKMGGAPKGNKNALKNNQNNQEVKKQPKKPQTDRQTVRQKESQSVSQYDSTDRMTDSCNRNSAASDTGGEFLGVINIPEDPAYALLREED